MGNSAELGNLSSEQRAVLGFFAGLEAGVWRVYEAAPVGGVLKQLAGAGLVTLNPYQVVSVIMYRPVVTARGRSYVEALTVGQEPALT